MSIVTVRKRVERAPEGRKLPLVEGKRLCDRKESLRKCVLLPSRVNHTHTHTPVESARLTCFYSTDFGPRLRVLIYRMWRSDKVCKGQAASDTVKGR